MTDWLIDFSFTRHSPAAAKDAGYIGAISYLSKSPEKNWDGVYRDQITRPGEVQAWLEAGMEVGFVWETTANRPFDGFDAGVEDADVAMTELDTLGAPPGTCIYYACDTNTDWDLVADYYLGVLGFHHGSSYPCGAYGSQSVVEGFMASGAKYGWQVATWGDRSGIANVFQEPNINAGLPEADANSIQHRPWGGWSLQQEDDFLSALSADEQRELLDKTRVVFDRVGTLFNDLGPIEVLQKQTKEVVDEINAKLG